MTPVKQTILHDPENGKFGDCFRACIASLLELPITAVPHFCDQYNPSWFRELNEWLAPRGYFFLEFGCEDPKGWEFWLDQCACGGDLYHTLCGPSPRFKDASHAVIGKNGKFVFDPHPSDAGLAGSPTAIGFLVHRGCRRDS